MPLFLLMSNLTPEGQQTLHRQPERLFEVNREVEAFGCKIMAQYAVLGNFDFATIVEAPDTKTVAQLSLDLGSRGTVAISTMPAIPIEDFLIQLKATKKVGEG